MNGKATFAQAIESCHSCSSFSTRSQGLGPPVLFVLGLVPFAAVGGWCTGSYSLASFPGITLYGAARKER